MRNSCEPTSRGLVWVRYRPRSWGVDEYELSVSFRDPQSEETRSDGPAESSSRSIEPSELSEPRTKAHDHARISSISSSASEYT